MNGELPLNALIAKILSKVITHVLTASIRMKFAYACLWVLFREVCHMLLKSLQRVAFVHQKPNLGLATIVVCEAHVVHATSDADSLRWSPEVGMDYFSICACVLL